MGRGLRELGIEWIPAYSPQAKGRVESCFGTLQDRLVKGLRLAGVNTTEEANRYLEEVFLPHWNRRFAKAPANPADVHRPVGPEQDLASSLALAESRRVGNDYTIAWDGRKWQIPKSAVGPGLRRAAIRIEQRLDGTLMARINGKAVELTVCGEKRPQVQGEKHPAKRFVPGPGESRWMPDE
jgi:hypothetical protein